MIFDGAKPRGLLFSIIWRCRQQAYPLLLATWRTNSIFGFEAQESTRPNCPERIYFDFANLDSHTDAARENTSELHLALKFQTKNAAFQKAGSNGHPLFR
jgi:hypothetical protein